MITPGKLYRYNWPEYIVCCANCETTALVAAAGGVNRLREAEKLLRSGRGEDTEGWTESECGWICPDCKGLS